MIDTLNETRTTGSAIESSAYPAENRLAEGPLTAIVSAIDTNRRLVQLFNDDPAVFVPMQSCETGYSLELIDQIFRLKGPFLCDEITRDESPERLQNLLKWNLLSYIDETEMRGKKVLDFGCGSGSSTSILGRMFSDSQFTGVELDHDSLSIARKRAEFYGLRNVEYLISPEPESLPQDIGQFDYIILTAVYEHLLPAERKKLLPMLWSALKPGGVIFFHDTPHRYFPVESHTTEGLFFLNYLPDRLAMAYAKKFSRANLKNDDWNLLLRKGIRGATIGEITGLLGVDASERRLLEPVRFGVSNRLELAKARWLQFRQSGKLRKSYYAFTKLLNVITGIELVPYLAIAVQKIK